MKKEKKQWQKPQIYNLGAVPEALGHCRDGSTQIGGACTNGQDTGLGSNCSSGSTPAPVSFHPCTTGGVAASTCAVGTSVN